MYQTRLMKFLDQINQLFFSKRYFDSESGVVENDSRGLPSTWVLSRSFCAYYCLDFTNVEESKKHVALENRLEVCSPFSNFGYWVPDMRQHIRSTLSHVLHPKKNTLTDLFKSHHIFNIPCIHPHLKLLIIKNNCFEKK